MIITGKKYERIDVYDSTVSIADSFVVNSNKTCSGHGEAKLYIGPKGEMRKFFTGNPHANGFRVNCFLRRTDLTKYMRDIKQEYYKPIVEYRGSSNGKINMRKLWKERVSKIDSLPEIIEFEIKEQNQIQGDRGYVKGVKRNSGYDLIREIALPFVSNISIMKVSDGHEELFYWLLCVDYQEMNELLYNAQHYGKKSLRSVKRERKGQASYKWNLFEKYGHCPFTGIDDIHLLIGSHIKPWYRCKGQEKTDVSNGFLFSPLYDKLFDKGYISFEDDGTIDISDWLSDENQQRISFNYDPKELKIDSKVREYLSYHRENIFRKL